MLFSDPRNAHARTHTRPLPRQHLLEKAREKGAHDNTFTEHNLSILFCNIEQLLSFHRQLVADLDSCLARGASYEAPIARCYLKFVSRGVVGSGRVRGEG